jgi:hypothetical protein
MESVFFNTIICVLARCRIISSDVSEGRSAFILSVNEFGSEASFNYPEYGGNTFLRNVEKTNIPHWTVTSKTVVETSLFIKWLRVFSEMQCSAQFLVLITACIFLFFFLIFSGNCFKIF